MGRIINCWRDLMVIQLYAFMSTGKLFLKAKETTPNQKP